MRKTPVSWDFVESGLLRIWTWATPHFEARIFGEGGGDGKTAVFNWSINDVSSGETKPFEDGMEQSFSEARDALLEVIGKSYPAKLGYQKYAGELATTYTIAGNKKLDFGGLQNSTVFVVYKNNDNRPSTVLGVLTLSNWDILVRVDSTTTVRIPPYRVLDVQAEDTRKSFITGENSQY